ncbi:MAG: NAD kinase, partial [Proteobacteria bacterium]|nr:NAD kinase [Pseudomonadota bacterium]
MIKKFHLVASESVKARSVFSKFQEKYNIINMPPEEADIMIVFGGDGFMLKSMRELKAFKKPFYGINCGHVGFLLNNFDFDTECFKTYINECVINVLNPLSFIAITHDEKVINDFAINEVALSRGGALASNYRVYINDKERISCSGDGILLSTPAGSTAYNASAGGVILPLTANLLALTPLCVYKPKNWKGAILNDNVCVEFKVDQTDTRPMNLTYDHMMIQNIKSLKVGLNKENPFHLLFARDT